jgi:hypothetical protein
MTKAQQAERDDAIAKLRAMLNPGDTVYTILEHVSRSGMSRDIRVVLMTCEDGRPVDLHPNYLVAKAIGERQKGDAIVMGGCGMDMGFHLVYSLGRVLFPDGFAPSDIAVRNSLYVNVNIGRGKNAGPLTKAEVDALVAKGWKFTRGRNGDTSGWDHEGGYALKQRWL